MKSSYPFKDMKKNRVTRFVLVLMGIFLFGHLIEEPAVAQASNAKTTQEAATNQTREDYRFTQDRFAIGLWVDPSASANLDERYAEAQRINTALKNLGPTLMQLTSTAVIRIKPKEDSAAALKNSALRSISDGDYRIGTFRHADGRRAVLLHNYHFAYSAWPTVTFDADAANVIEVNPKTGKETPVVDDSPDMPGLQLSLDAGEGRVFLLPPERLAQSATLARLNHHTP